MIKKNYENHIYTTIPPELDTPLTELEKHEHIDTTSIEIDDYEKEQIIKALLEEEEYFNKLIDTEPKEAQAQ